VSHTLRTQHSRAKAADLGCLLCPSISSALLYSDARWPRKLVIGPYLPFLPLCSVARSLEDAGFKEGGQTQGLQLKTSCLPGALVQEST